MDWMNQLGSPLAQYSGAGALSIALSKIAQRQQTSR
jgi:hypothetical protein